MQYTVAVRALCEFTAKAGDLDLRFTPSPSAQEGIAGHAWVTASRGASYEREISVEGRFDALRVRGRADGYDPGRNRLEEIKTFRGDLARQPANHRHLHWAQAKVYGWLLCEARDLQQLDVALVYLDLATHRETVLQATHGREELKAFFDQQCALFLAWARQELAHREERDTGLGALAFPYPEFREGQRDLAEAAYRAAAQGRCLMAQAPTGIGKTVGTLFPVLKAVPGRRLDKVFFLAAKTPGRQLALDALGVISRASPALPLRVLELTARDKACEHPDKACHGDSCPLARGFYDRLPAARSEALAEREMHGPRLRQLALRHQVCPYYLSQELARWSDVVVGDYHYFFDASALLHALAADNGWQAAVLVDEAHNLVERGREMYSAQMDPAALAALRRAAPAPLRRSLARLAKAWTELGAAQEQAYQAYEEVPDRWLGALQNTAAAIADHLAEVPQEPLPELQQFYFDALAMLRLAETFGEHSVFDVSLRPGRKGTEAVPCIRNLVPAPFLSPRFKSAHGTVLFSATLGPAAFYRDTLGLPDDVVAVDVASPFRAEQLSVHLVRSISTRWADRERSLEPIAELIARHYRQQPGNYLAFFSSFDYLQRACAQLREKHPDLPVFEQSRAMPEARRREFIDRFVPGGFGIGFAVLGGSFGEAIDLPGDRLVGAFIATLGLPQVNPVNEEMRRRMGRLFGAGYDYAYLYPGIRKVVQAAGRVIRTREDRGTVVLIDDRFAQPAVRALLPSWWEVQLEVRSGIG
ncbi:MAG: DinG family ATP-dependent helicase CPE1197 [uncultured Ramlibacter sp.]|uniref:DinG family ATP-dependent helicase CPE1197 n=1 Tax=uncultured Ramlibacter sp. TaxID=260755 RepID=A0A6J4Q862_9BURK|nr:MAG: DinG family ATP-dependent helicase CPE1197 [uncultured Ramlibacter sp.]